MMHTFLLNKLHILNETKKKTKRKQRNVPCDTNDRSKMICGHYVQKSHSNLY